MKRLFAALFCVLTQIIAVSSLHAASDTRYLPKTLVSVPTAAWAKSATLYELNTRQFTPEGTFRAAEKQLPRLKALGVDIIWLMPIHPIGLKNRKGSLGSPYSVRDYRAVNPEFGTVADLKAFVLAAHRLGMHVILDWVGNHTAWDNVLIDRHPDYYDRDWKGNFHPTVFRDWGDIIDLDYSKPGLRKYLTESMEYWVRDVGVDGFRCDVAYYVPRDFWDTVRAKLNAIKPVFMLAEAETRDLHDRAFDATYAWPLYNAMRDIAQRKSDVGALDTYYADTQRGFPAEAMRMAYVENHDTNAWEGTQFEAFGDSLAAATALSVVGEGIPLLHNGQEAGNHKRLAFFDKDPIVWKDDPIAARYTKLFALKHANPALWNGIFGGKMIPVVNDHSAAVFSFVRRKRSDKVFAVFNFSKAPVIVSFADSIAYGHYADDDNGASAEISATTKLAIPAWGYKIYVYK